MAVYFESDFGDAFDFAANARDDSEPKVFAPQDVIFGQTENTLGYSAGGYLTPARYYFDHGLNSLEEHDLSDSFAFHVERGTEYTLNLIWNSAGARETTDQGRISILGPIQTAEPHYGKGRSHLSVSETSARGAEIDLRSFLAEDDGLVHINISARAEHHGRYGHTVLPTGYEVTLEQTGDRIWGNRWANESAGSAHADRIFGQDGDDTLFGMGSSDLLRGGQGDDVLLGGAGNDRLFGQWGEDRLEGGAGHDFLVGGMQDDVVIGGDGNDTIQTGMGEWRPRWREYWRPDFTVYDGAEDTAYGGNGDDVLLGPGALFGEAGNDEIHALHFGFGGQGNDILVAGAAGATLSGGQGDDTLRVDYLPFHDKDPDRNALQVTLNGGQGRDLFELSGWNRNIGIEDFGWNDRLSFYGEYSIAHIDGDTLITTDNGLAIRLEGFEMHAWAADQLIL